jgi:hypothetical protein
MQKQQRVYFVQQVRYRISRVAFVGSRMPVSIKILINSVD